MTPLILDTDPGVDDAFALALAVTSPEVELRAVTTVFGNTALPAATDNARRLLSLYGREDIPVGAGADRPLVHPQPAHTSSPHGEDGLSGHAATLPEPAGPPDARDAVSLMREVLQAADDPVTIVAIGPLTNIAALFAAHPSVVPKIGKLVIMGGGLVETNVTAAAEFNVWSDPEAAHRVLTEGRVPTTLVPLDLTLRCTVGSDWLGRLRASGATGRTLVRLTGHYWEWQRRQRGDEGLALHDMVAVAEAVRPGILGTTTYPVEVDCSLGPGRGMVIADRRPGRNGSDSAGNGIAVALDADPNLLNELALDRLTALSRRHTASPRA